MRLNKKLIVNALDRIADETFTFNDLFEKITEELEIDNNLYPKIYRFMDVINTIEIITGINEETIKSRTRRREVVDVRQVAMYLVQKYTRLNLKKTGELFNRDHATVLHAKRRVEDAKNGFNNELREIVELCETSLLTEDDQ